MLPPLPAAKLAVRAATGIRGLARLLRRLVSAAGQPWCWPALLGSLLFFAFFLLVPPPQGRRDVYSTVLLAEGGELLGALVSADGQWRFPSGSSTGALAGTQAGQIATDRYYLAVTSYEDKRFAGHVGIDSRALLRALRDNIQRRGIVSGASTLSMQCARLLFGNRPRTYPQKILEILTAVRLELRMSKRELLGLYAGLAPYGANVVGMEAASFRWFGHSAGSLTWAEAALLAVLPNSPGLIHPGRSRELLQAKRDRLLRALAASGQLDAEQLQLALFEPLPVQALPVPQLAPHALQQLRLTGSSRTPDDALIMGQSLRLDYRLQSNGAVVIERQYTRLSRQGINNLAGIVMRVDDGSIAAWFGNVSPSAGRPGSYVDCALAARSSGSILKPFLYAAMLDSGELTPQRLVADIPTRVGSYSPENNLKTFSGAVPANHALARSLNIPFVRLLRDYGVERFGRLLTRLGFAKLHRAYDDYGLTLILGGAENSLLEAAAAYRQLALSALSGSQNAAGSGAGFSPGAAWLTLDALIHVPRPAEEAAWQHYASSRLVSWKTGTSFGNRDAWAIGVSPEYVVAVWVGNADGVGRPEIKGTDAAAPVLFDLFQLLPRGEWFPRPLEHLKMVTVCASSGYIAGSDCVATERIAVPALAHVDKTCPYCRLVHLSADRSFRVTTACVSPLDMVSERRFVLPPVMEWYYVREVSGYQGLPPWLPGCDPGEQAAFDLITPEENTRLFIPVELDGQPGRTVFRAIHRDPAATLFWHLDGEYLGETRGDHHFELKPPPGTYLLTLVDSAGASLSRRFTVLGRD